ncbi:MAG: hypothetical protein A2017_19145 [Lentisphaerae bacterium GWF2_44_16]|nr:MAG: hypothetical protein A2017_19145 [Lentisphaerae bacterium GWF2_44_16]
MNNSIRLHFNKIRLYILGALQISLFNILIVVFLFFTGAKYPNVLPYILFIFQIVMPFIFMFFLINFYLIFFDEKGIRLEICFIHVNISWDDIIDVLPEIGMYRIKTQKVLCSYRIPRAFIYKNKNEIYKFISNTVPIGSPLRKIWPSP